MPEVNKEEMKLEIQIARLDERFSSFEKKFDEKMTELKDGLVARVESLEKKYDNLVLNRLSTSDFNQFRQENARTSVSQEEFKPVKSIVYGMVAFILLAFIGGLITLVLK